MTTRMITDQQQKYITKAMHQQIKNKAKFHNTINFLGQTNPSQTYWEQLEINMQNSTEPIQFLPSRTWKELEHYNSTLIKKAYYEALEMLNIITDTVQLIMPGDN